MEIKLILLVFFFVFALELSGQSVLNSPSNKFEFYGKLSKSEGKWVYLTKEPYFDNNISTDSVQSDASGRFVFRGNMNEPTSHLLQVGDQWVKLLLEPGTIQITGNADSLDQIQITGGGEETIRRIYLDSMARYRSDIVRDQILSAKYGGDTARLKILEGKFSDMRARERQVRLELMRAYPLASTSIYHTSYFLTSHESGDLAIADSLLKLYEGPKTAHYEQVKFLRRSWNTAKKLVLGEPAGDFVQYDTTGNEVHLMSLRGRYLLVDFWASWCGPCRQENPLLVAIKKEFSGRNFDIVSVSLDDDSKAWLKAIKADQMNWQHVSDLKGWKNKAVRAYGIDSIPFNFLLNPEGDVLGINIKGVDLAAFLRKNLP